MHRITEALMSWYDENAREMPWRGISDPYGTWVSEIMLQQTRVETVRDYYPRFMERFPTLRDLAEAPEEDVLKMWEGLGYYSRARNLRKGAQQVMSEYGGMIPREPEQLIRIKGIGPYTSCSIASIAFDVPVPAVDGNVIRVISRVYDLHEDPTETKAHEKIEQLAAELVPQRRAGDHNQAMMDLGATICVPGTPDCDSCPLKKMCKAFVAGTAEELPHLPKAKPPKEIAYDVLLIHHKDQVLMYRRTESMLQGLWCFPMLEGQREEKELIAAVEKKWKLKVKSIIFEQQAKHIFTHQVWEMSIYTITIEEEKEVEGMEWVKRDQIADLPLPTAMKAAKLTLKL